MTAFTLGGVVREAAQRYGDLPALVGPDGDTVTYRELDRRSDAVAAALEPDGLVVLLLGSTPEYVIVSAAVSKAGGAVAGVNPRLTEAEIQAVLEVVRPARVITPDDVPRADAPAPRHAEDLDRHAVVCFTSGTTGTPKAAAFTGRQLEAISHFDTAGAQPVPGRAMLASTEFAHVGFMTKLGWQLRLGMRVHMLGRWRAPDALRTIAEQRIASVGGIPAQIALMLRQPDFDAYDLTHVESIVVGGGHSPPELIDEACRRFGARYSVRYSSTESGGVGTIADGDDALTSVGRPRPGIDLEVRDDGGRVVPHGETGEIWLRSPAAMDGYLNDPEATAQTLVDGWLSTGDLGHLDDADRLCLAGRTKEMFIRGGYNVYPLEVERVLQSHPLVSDVAIVPRPDAVMGEIGVAVVVPADAARPPSLSDLRDHASARLAAYKLPEDVRIVDALPLTSMHKVDRRRLAACV